MKLDAPQNPNYAAVVFRVQHLVKLENADRLLGLPAFGLQAIVDLNTKVGDLGLLFPAECQLSFDYAFQNNLHSHGTKDVAGTLTQLNKNPAARGYFGNTRRVRAIRLRGNRSDALFMPLSSLEYLGVDVSSLKEGDVFDSINGAEICRKYVVPRNGSNNPANVKKKQKSRVDVRLFPEHFETRQFLRVQETLNPYAHVVVTQKLHGSSIRIGNIPVSRSLPLRDRIAKRFGVKVQEHEYSMIFGSRKVIKDSENPNQNNFYGNDIWTTEGGRLKGVVPENFLLFGEIIGWADAGKPIQKNYTYCLPPATRKIYIYRVATINGQGTLVDLSWEATKRFCISIGIDYVPEFWSGTLKDFDVDFWMDKRYREFLPNALPLDDAAPCDEGVCLRIDDGLIPTIVKAKSPLFLQHESKMLDENAVDMEADESTLDDVFLAE